MAMPRLFFSVACVASALMGVQAQDANKATLILADCGIGDNAEHLDWSTSRQMNWYESLTWPDSAYKYPAAPNMAVEIPFKDGVYPWTPSGVTAKMPNDDVWTAYIENATPDGFKAGTAVGSRNAGETLNCWAYRGRPVSAAVNKTANHDAICWSAFVCNHDEQPPNRPDDMDGQKPTQSTSTAPPTSTTFSQPPSTPTATHQPPNTGVLSVNATLSPRFINWPSTWEAFINNFVWDQITGNCVGNPYKGTGFSIIFKCSGVQIDADTHMTLTLIKALHDIGSNSLWFSQSPVVPSGNVTNSTSSWVVLPETFNLTATDVASQKIIGHISYETKYNNFQAGPCSTCEIDRFNATFFDPLIEAMKGTYPEYNSYHVQASCNPWLVC